MSDVVVEYLVVGDEEQTLVRSEVEHQLLEVAHQGPPGPRFGDGDVELADQNILGARTIGFFSERDNGDSAASLQILFALGQKQRVRITQNTVLELVGAGAPVGHYQLRMIQDPLGNHDCVWEGLDPTRWLNTDVVPEVNKVPNGESILSLFWDGFRFTQSLAKVGRL